jgi:hypothetical protein
MKIHDKNKKEESFWGGREDIIKLINLHLLYHYSFLFFHIFTMKLQLKFKIVYNY